MPDKPTDTLLQWLPEYAIGVASIDAEHREIIGLINSLYACYVAGGDKATVAAFLGEVHAWISAHFALEERMMQDNRYDDYDGHKAEHEQLLDQIGDIIDIYEAEGFFSAEEFAQVLSDWFAEHFRTKDARLHHRLG